MKELARSVQLAREPTFIESVAIRDAVERALVGLGAEVSQVSNTGLKFHIPAPWKTGKLNPLFAVTGGAIDVSAGAGARRRLRYTLSFTRLRAYAAAAIIAIGGVALQWTRPTLIILLLLAWVFVFMVPWLIASHRFRRFVTRASDDAMRTKRIS